MKLLVSVKSCQCARSALKRFLVDTYTYVYKRYWQPSRLDDFEAMHYTTMKPGIVTCKLPHGDHLGSLIYFLTVLGLPSDSLQYILKMVLLHMVYYWGLLVQLIVLLNS